MIGSDSVGATNHLFASAFCSRSILLRRVIDENPVHWQHTFVETDALLRNLQEYCAAHEVSVAQTVAARKGVVAASEGYKWQALDDSTRGIAPLLP